MIHRVRLTKLPQELEFPEEMCECIWYEESRQSLAFDGFMSKATFDRLEALHRDLEYRRALEELFRIAVPEDCLPQPRRQTLLWLAAGVMLVLMASVLGLFQWYAN